MIAFSDHVDGGPNKDETADDDDEAASEGWGSEDERDWFGEQDTDTQAAAVLQSEQERLYEAEQMQRRYRLAGERAAEADCADQILRDYCAGVEPISVPDQARLLSLVTLQSRALQLPRDGAALALQQQLDEAVLAEVQRFEAWNMAADLDSKMRSKKGK